MGKTCDRRKSSETIAVLIPFSKSKSSGTTLLLQSHPDFGLKDPTTNLLKDFSLRKTSSSSCRMLEELV